METGRDLSLNKHESPFIQEYFVQSLNESGLAKRIKDIQTDDGRQVIKKVRENFQPR